VGSSSSSNKSSGTQSRPTFSNTTATSNDTTSAVPLKQNQTSSVSSSSSKKVPENSTQTSGESSSGSKSDNGITVNTSSESEDNADSHNDTYPLFHYEDIQREWNFTQDSIQHSNVSEAFLNKVTPMALQKNLSTTKTPFLPWEKEQPADWPKVVGVIFLCAAVLLIAATVVRNIRNNKRKNYEEIQSLVV
jgi:hypothetical protein